MTNKSKNSYDISYSLEIDSSTYYILGQHLKKEKSRSTYSLAQDAFIGRKSTEIPSTLSARLERSKSLGRSVSTEHRPKSSRHRSLTNDTHLSSKPQKSNSKYIKFRRSARSKPHKVNRIVEKTRKSECEILSESIRSEPTGAKSNSLTSSSKKRKPSVRATTNHQKQDIIQIFDEQKHSLVQLLEQYTRSMMIPSSNDIQRIVNETLKSHEQIVTKEFECTLIQTIQQMLQDSRLKTNKQSQSTTLDVHTVSQLEEILTQTIEKHIASTNENDQKTWHHLFAEQKQTLVETLIQQFSSPLIDLIKTAVTDALGVCNSSPLTTNTTHVNISSEIKITADLKQTRVDAAFRQQRDSVVANRYLRDMVRQWVNIRSISSLVKKIQTCSTNNLEDAWLLFCWMGQNIRLDSSSENTTAESVLQKRTAACQGFVTLYEECCSSMNIPCSKVSGYTKYNFLKHNEHLEKSPHQWIGIVLDQYKHLIDPTLGSGGVDNINEFQDCYFLTSPEEFIYTHYSVEHQLLQPEITKQEFLHLPVIQSNYYRLNLKLLSPKRAFNHTNGNIFRISIKIPAYVDLVVSLKIDQTEYPRHLHTLCQRDITQTDTINCYLAPPTNGPYQMIVSAKTNHETTYRDAIYMRLNVSNMTQAITFPIIHEAFSEYKCILIEPFRCLVQENDRILIHMKIPDANAVKIKNGDDYIVPNQDEYQHAFLKKEIYVQGDIQICARWGTKTNRLLPICVFSMM